MRFLKRRSITGEFEDVVYRFYHQSLKVYYDLCSLGTHIRRFLVRRHEGVVIATENSAKVTRTQQFKALGRLRSIPDDVAQADKLLNALIVDVLKDSSQRREFDVNITDDGNGLHVRQWDQPASRTA